MSQAGQHTLHEIESQPEAWAATLAELRTNSPAVRQLFTDTAPEQVAFVGCGSPFYLAQHAAALLNELGGPPAYAIPGAELWLSPHAALPGTRRTLLVALSRSGETSETIRAVEGFRATGRGAVLTISNYPDRPLNVLGDLHLTLAAGQEQSLAQTRAFTTLQLAATVCAALWSSNDGLIDQLNHLPDACRRFLASAGATARQLGNDAAIDRFYFLGSGSRNGLASELSLKMKEMSLSHSEPFHVLEFRHGPRAMATSGALVIGLISPTNAAFEHAVLHDMRAQGASTLSIGMHGCDISFGSDLDDRICGPLCLPFGQLLAHTRALLNGQDPDLPSNLAAVVRLP
ncbi:MAG TPA: SIS domain-containing protein [Roseiflexaceae bacterium]|nr:SIS domain-containing protein [Roseiflexaceae bacterium]HMP42279.1 SIS domain-containing protein [Roseiflexaceae bacterium]